MQNAKCSYRKRKKHNAERKPYNVQAENEEHTSEPIEDNTDSTSRPKAYHSKEIIEPGVY